MRPVHVVGAALVCAAGALAACNVVLGLDDLKDQVDGGTADTGAGDAGSDAGPNCTDYCAAIGDVCKVPNKQYFDQPTCLAMCAAFSGDSGATGPLVCRLGFLQVVQLDISRASTACPSAGPYSTAIACGGEAQNFCALYTSMCGDAAYSPAGCQSAFAGFGNPDSGGSFIPITPGNTRVCREYYLEAAYQTGGSSGCDEASWGSVGGACAK